MGIKIIKLWDNENYQYPLIEINEEYFKIFKNRLKEYQKNEEYNIDDFIDSIKKEKWFIRSIYFDVEMFF